MTGECIDYDADIEIARSLVRMWQLMRFITTAVALGGAVAGWAWQPILFVFVGVILFLAAFQSMMLRMARDSVRQAERRKRESEEHRAMLRRVYPDAARSLGT